MGYSSQAGHVLVRTQASKGTYATDIDTDGVCVKLRSGSLAPTRELLIPDPEIGGGRDVVDAYLGAGAFSGDLEFYARMDALAAFLAACLGGVSSNTVTGVTTHTITGSDDNELPYLSIEEGIGSDLEVFNYTDAVVNTLHLEAEANGYLIGSVGLIAAKQTAGNTATADLSDLWDNTPMIVGTNITVTYNSVALPAKSFSFDINNNLEDDDFRLGSFYLSQMTPKRREVTASFSIRPEDSDLWRQAVYGTTVATEMGGVTTKNQLVIAASTYENITGGTPSTPWGVTLTVPKFGLRPYGLSPSGDDILENDVEGQALRPDPAVSIVTAVVKNGKEAVA